MYYYNDEDSVFASDQAKADYTATCSRLEDAWKAMCLRYNSLLPGGSRLVVNVSQLSSPTLPTGSMVGGPPASGDIYSAAIWSALDPPAVSKCSKPRNRFVMGSGASENSRRLSLTIRW